MSVQAITWALSARTGGPRAKCVLLCVANYANENGLCWPSQGTIADETEQSVRTVQRCLDDLQTSSLIDRIPCYRTDGSQTTDRIVLMINEACRQFATSYRAALRDRGGVDTNTGAGGDNLTGGVAKRTPPSICQGGDVTPVTPGTTLRSPPNEPSIEPSAEPSEDSPLRGSALAVIDTNVSHEAIPVELHTLAAQKFDDEFWPAFPKREGSNPKKPARDKFINLVVKHKINPDLIIAGAKAYAIARDGEPSRFTVSAIVWLNQHRWTEDHSQKSPYHGARPNDRNGRRSAIEGTDRIREALDAGQSLPPAPVV